MNQLRRVRLRYLCSAVHVEPPRVFANAAELLEVARRDFCEIAPEHFAALLSAASQLQRLRVMQQMSKHASSWQSALLPVYGAFMLPESAYLSVFGNLVEFMDSNSVFCFLTMFASGRGDTGEVALPPGSAHMLAWVLCITCKYHPQVGFSLLRILGPRVCETDERGSGLLYTPRTYLMQAFMRLQAHSGELAQSALNPLLQLTIGLTLQHDEIDKDVAQFIAGNAEEIDFATVRFDNLQVLRQVLDRALDLENCSFDDQNGVLDCTRQARVLQAKESLKNFDRRKGSPNRLFTTLFQAKSPDPGP